MLAFRAVLLLSLLLVCSIAPGFLFVHRLRWKPLETLCASIGLSLFLVYLAVFTLYWLNVDLRWCWAVTGLWVVLGVLGARRLGHLCSSPQVRRPVLGFGFLLLWMLLLLALVRHYGGGNWINDWLEHFHRTMFFLKHLPVRTETYPPYQLASRPPMMNLLAAYFLAQVGFRFEWFELTFAFLNLLVFLPCCLLARVLVKRGASMVMLVSLLALNPMFMENLTYTWTKLLAVFYVLLGLWFYLAGWRRRDGVRTAAGFASFATGALVHYSVGPYLVFVLGHYLVRFWRDRQAHWREALLAAGMGTAILSMWFAWSIAVYGVRGTFTSYTGVSGAKAAAGPLSVKIALNIFDTLVPHPLRSDVEEMFLWKKQQSRLGRIRDYAFLIYQTNLIGTMGAVGGPVVLVLFIRAAGRFWRRSSPPEPRFWLWFAVVCAVLGIAVQTVVYGEHNTFGVAHIALQPLVILGVVWLAASFRFLPRAVRWAIIAGCAFDFATGIFLQVHLENFELESKSSPDAMFSTISTLDEDGSPALKIAWKLSGTASGNLLSKYVLAPTFGYEKPQDSASLLSSRLLFLGDHAAGLAGALKGVVLFLAALMITAMGREGLRVQRGQVSTS